MAVLWQVTALLIILLLNCHHCSVNGVDISINSASSLRNHLCDAGTLEPNTAMKLALEVYEMNEGSFCTIANLSNITLLGVGNEPSVIRCTHIDGMGFAFFNITNIAIENVRFEQCGHEIPYDIPPEVNETYTYLGPSQKAVLLITHSSNLVLRKVTVDRSFGMGVIGINLLGDSYFNEVAVSNTDNFQHPLCSNFTSIQDLSCSGSGIVIVYSDDHITDDQGGNATLTVANSSFENNSNIIPLSEYVLLYVAVRSARITEPFLLSGASGLALFVGQLNYHLTVHITDTTVKNSVGSLPGVLLGYFNSLRNTKVEMRQCTVSNNVVFDYARGGGMLVLIAAFIDRLNSFPEYSDDPFQLLTITQSQFLQNVASTGGAIYFHLPPQNISNSLIMINDTVFAGNLGAPGAAIEASVIQSTFIQKSFQFVFQDVEAYQNQFHFNDIFTFVTVENSAVFEFIAVHNVTVTGTAGKGGYFHDNHLGVFVMSGGNFHLRGHNAFKRNIAFNGGAVSLYDNALMYINDNSNLLFEHNKALRFGGAIYINSLGTGISKACSIQIIGSANPVFAIDVYKLNLSITFTDNSAGESGNSIFANPLYNCGYLPEASITHSSFLDNEQQLYNSIFTYTATESDVTEISSIPYRVCLCNESQFNGVCLRSATVTSIVVPGQTFKLSMVATDVVGTPVTSLLYAIVPGNDNVSLPEEQQVRQIVGTFSQCNKVDFVLYGFEHSSATIQLFTHPGGQVSTIDVYISGCPPAFQLSSLTQQCECEAFITDILETMCNTTTYSVVREKNGWIGTHGHPNITKEVVYVTACPIDYCQSTITEIDLSQPDFLCAKGRTGLLCGACKNGLSVIFGSANCSQCSHYWLFTILLYALSGIVLVFIIFLLNLTVQQGSVNGLIFYVNVVSVNANIFFRSPSSSSFLFVFISLLNLELGFPLCFYSGMDEKTKVGLQFVFPVYLLFICGAIIAFSRWSSHMQKLTSSSGVAVLGTLFYLIFSKILRTVIDILSFATLVSYTDSHIIWLFDGNVHYFQGLHILLMLAAVVTILAFIFPYTLSLTLIQYQSRLPTWPRLKPLIDTYTAPYKDKWRNWIGFRLCLLIVLCVTYAIEGTNNPSLTLLLQIIFMLFFSLCQACILPYRLTSLELLDMFFLVNFTLLCLVTSYGLQNVHEVSLNLGHFINFMLSLAFIAFVGILVWSAIRQLCTIPSIKAKTDEWYTNIKTFFLGLFKRKSIKQDEPQTPSIVLTEFNTSMHSPQCEPTRSRDHSRNITVSTSEICLDATDSSASQSAPTPDLEYRPKVMTFSKLREPVLDFT